MRLWTWILDLAKRRLHAAASHDRRCPNCLRWTSEAPGCLTEDRGPVQAMICAACGWESLWDMTYGPAVLLRSTAVAAQRLAMWDLRKGE